MARKDKSKNVTSSEENLDLFKFLAINNGLEYLKDFPGCPDGIKSMEHKNFYGNGSKNRYLDDDFFDLIMTDSRVSEKTYKYLISPISKENENIWYLGYPHLIHAAYKNNNMKRFNELLSIADKNNKYAISHVYDMTEIDRGRERYASGYHLYQGKYGVVPIQKRTIDLALDRQDNDLAVKLIEMNKLLKTETRIRYDYGVYGKGKYTETSNTQFSNDAFVYDPYQLKIEMLNRDTKTSEIDKHIQRAVHDGIININELIYAEKNAIKPGDDRGDLIRNNLNKIFAALREYPIDEIELYLNLVKKKDWSRLEELVNSDKNIFKKASYTNIRSTDCITEKDSEKTIEQLTKLYDDQHRSIREYWLARNYNESLESLYKRIKNKIIDDMKLENSMFEKASKLDKSYFNKLLKKENYRDILIDLCVRLETVLEGEYNLTGDLSECVDKYFDRHPSREMRELIHKLIRCRNNAVHRKTSNESMDSVELQKCIDYICNFK